MTNEMQWSTDPELNTALTLDAQKLAAMGVEGYEDFAAPEPPPKPLTLAEITAKYVEEEEASCGEVTQALDALSEAFDQKALNYLRFDEAQGSKEAGLRAQYDYYMELAEPFKKRADTIAKRRKDLRAHLLEAMKITGKTSIETVARRIYIKYSDSVKVVDTFVDTAAEEFVQTTKAPKLAVLAALFRDKVKEHLPRLPKGQKEHSEEAKRAAREAAMKELPEGVRIETSENLQL